LPTQRGTTFGPAWTNHWFKVGLSFPPEWSQYPKVQLEFDSSGEAMVYTERGDIQHGLTGGFGRDRRVEYIIPDDVVASGKATYYIEASCNAMFGQANLENPDPNNVGQDILDIAGDEQRYYRLNCADLVAVNVTAQNLLWDYVAIQQLSTCLAEGSSLRYRAQRTANDIINCFRPDDPDTLSQCRKLAESILGRNWEERSGLGRSAADRKGRVLALGHW
jgi:alpha-mannosidase